jgi:glycosyltransferase-like protein
MNVLRIALLTHSVNPRGGVVHTLELAAALTLLGHDVTVFVPATRDEVLFRVPPCRVVYAPITLPQSTTVQMVEARIDAFHHALLDEDVAAFDVLHAQDSISGNALADLKEQGVIRGFVRTVHHLDYFDHPQLAAWQRRAYQDADRVLCVSDRWTREMRTTFGVDALTVPNGVDVKRFSALEDHHDVRIKARFGIGDGPVVLAVGGIEARKNTLALVEAFARVHDVRPDVQLVIAGGASLLDHDAYSRGVSQRAEELGLCVGPHKTVIVTGPLEDAVMPALFRLADVLSMVSLREGFGLVVLEALASGTPVVASSIAPFTEYLDDATCCWADPADIDSIAVALIKALDNHTIDFAHAVPALLTRFSWHASALRHLDAYRHFVASRAVLFN